MERKRDFIPIFFRTWTKGHDWITSSPCFNSFHFPARLGRKVGSMICGSGSRSTSLIRFVSAKTCALFTQRQNWLLLRFLFTLNLVEVNTCPVFVEGPTYLPTQPPLHLSGFILNFSQVCENKLHLETLVEYHHLLSWQDNWEDMIGGGGQTSNQEARGGSPHRPSCREVQPSGTNPMND